MKLEDIGFYTLSNKRAKQTSTTSPMWRCELIVTDRCNFSCPYCRKMAKHLQGDIPLDTALSVLSCWTEQGLKHVRFSGGEPTMYKNLPELIALCKNNHVERIAVSTNGSANLAVYDELIDLGVDDFSISLDACCAADGKQMSGGVDRWTEVIDHIEYLAKKVYVSVGIVLTDDNKDKVLEIITLAYDLGVADIRVIPAAQDTFMLTILNRFARQRPDIFAAHPILRYRMKMAYEGLAVRGLTYSDSHQCWLVLDDSCVVQNWHFPCVIYMREGGDPIGRIGMALEMRQERYKWVKEHDTHEDVICYSNCLDVCRDYNNAAWGYQYMKIIADERSGEDEASHSKQHARVKEASFN